MKIENQKYLRTSIVTSSYTSILCVVCGVFEELQNVKKFIDLNVALIFALIFDPIDPYFSSLVSL